ncbi:hypothetical protein OVY01_22765 [Robbsia sp. Bb-Pol-6]|uniref:Uncharacterized protein n=1 Tax=Robbsia betulipollinis TaxID=2981849 RepID=A0ABT3ZTT4_9BURK|nr:hypothetical protein [Robbsia betulipollinis]MCY0389964.1 hypothetical protein [Robbsia betulipollinis]
MKHSVISSGNAAIAHQFARSDVEAGVGDAHGPESIALRPELRVTKPFC